MVSIFLHAKTNKQNSVTNLWCINQDLLVKKKEKRLKVNMLSLQGQTSKMYPIDMNVNDLIYLVTAFRKRNNFDTKYNNNNNNRHQLYAKNNFRSPLIGRHNIYTCFSVCTCYHHLLRICTRAKLQTKNLRTWFLLTKI